VSRMPTKRLVLMRHAKSSWKSDAPTDHARPLNGRGRRDSPKVGAELARRGWVPDRVLSSDSARTRETFARMREALGVDDDARFTRALYHAGVDAVREALAALDDGVETALILGHNPGWEEVLEWLSGEDHEMKTATCALLSVEAATWPAAVEAAGDWAVADVIYPRSL